MSKLSEREQHTRRILNLLVNVSGLTDGEVGMRCGISQQLLNDRRRGRTRIRLEERADLARGLGVPEFLFDMEVPEVLRWLADNGRDLLITASPCTTAPDSFRVPCAA